MFLFTSCASEHNPPSREDIWRLSWRVWQSAYLLKDYQLGASQFDSLLVMSDSVSSQFYASGLECLARTGRTDQFLELLAKVKDHKSRSICNTPWIEPLLGNRLVQEWCDHDAKLRQPADTALYNQLMVMYINDQLVRGNSLEELVDETGYAIKKSDLYNNDGAGMGTVDFINREKLTKMIAEVGFPTKKMVGPAGMMAVWAVIQHSDSHPEFQQQQLPFLKKAAESGDMQWQLYAYLYDRVCRNTGREQLYGTQFAGADPVTKRLTLAPTTDMEQLDQRRMQMGMMPIALYEQLMRSSLE